MTTVTGGGTGYTLAFTQGACTATATGPGGGNHATPARPQQSGWSKRARETAPSLFVGGTRVPPTCPPSLAACTLDAWAVPPGRPSRPPAVEPHAPDWCFRGVRVRHSSSSHPSARGKAAPLPADIRVDASSRRKEDMTAALPTRMIALLGLAIAGLAAFLVVRPALLDRGSDAATPAPVVTPSKTGSTPAPSTPSTPAPTKLVLLPGLPTAVARELRYEKVVVVALYSSPAALDRRVRGQAEAGAKSVDAGFVGLNLYNEHNAREASAFADSTASPPCSWSSDPARSSPASTASSTTPSSPRPPRTQARAASRWPRGRAAAAAATEPAEIFSYEARKDGRPVVVLRGFADRHATSPSRRTSTPSTAQPSRKGCAARSRSRRASRRCASSRRRSPPSSTSTASSSNSSAGGNLRSATARVALHRRS